LNKSKGCKVLISLTTKCAANKKHDNPWNPMEESHHFADLNQRRNKSIPANVPKKKVNIDG
jgi:hypothetical protein